MAMASFAADHADEAAFPAALLLIMLLFLLVQDQIDRRDPKLALAPIEEPELPFASLPVARTAPTRQPLHLPGDIWTASRLLADKENA